MYEFVRTNVIEAIMFRNERWIEELEGGECSMKEWTCVQVGHHNRIGEVIVEPQRQGWRFHTYQAQGSPTMVNHYLLFERDT